MKRVIRVRTIRLIVLPLILLFVLAAGRRRETQTGEIRIRRLFLEVLDGDTVRYRGTPMRFLGVDTPELKNPAHGFYKDQPYGREAANFTRMEIKKAKVVTCRTDGRDVYDRLLVHLFVDGYPLSLLIVEAGMGYETVSAFGDGGFPEISERILEASRSAGCLPFENPYLWRRKNRLGPQ
ncbi:MAG: thermonuclease family protein [Spirochaetes bacterium]|nr:thermonuclease family protein [Spirochaetota bacterium]